MQHGVEAFTEAGVEMPNAMEYMATGFENLKSVALVVFNGIASVVGPVFDFMVGLFEEYFGWLNDLINHVTQFGMHTGESFDGLNGVVEAFGSVVSTVFGYVGPFIQATISFIATAIKELVFAFLNLDLVIQGWGITIAEAFTTVVDRANWLWANIKIGAEWFITNFPDIFATGLDYALTALINWGENIRSVFASVADFIGSAFSAIWAAIKNGTVTGLGDALKQAVDEFQPTIKATFEGAHSSIKKGPAFQDFKPSLDFTGQKEQLANEWAKRREEWDGITKEKPLEIGAEGKGEGKDKEGAGSFQALGTAFEKANSAVAKAQEKKDREMLDLNQKQLVEQQNINKNLANLKVGGLK
jgi:hypothetical protein